MTRPQPRLLHRLALAAETLIERLRPSPRRPPLLEAYGGYATPEQLVIRGRVLTSLRRSQPDPRQGILTNARQMLGLFLTREVADVPVVGGGARVQSDAEGYFRLEVARPPLPPGWHQVPIEIPGLPDTQVLAPVLVSHPAARFAVISDIDDTVLKTGAYSLWRNLWTSLTGNALTRHVFPDAVRLLTHLHADGSNPVFYVSSGPWNLHAFLHDLLAHHRLARGPIILQDFGLARDKLITAPPGAHKSAAIDELMTAQPDLPFVLVGDTGQQDPLIYADAAERWPGRVWAVFLRQAQRRPRGGWSAAVERLSAAGVAVHVASDFDAVSGDVWRN